MNFARINFEDTIIQWMRKNVQIVEKLSRSDVWNKKIQEKKEMLFTRDDY